VKSTSNKPCDSHATYGVDARPIVAPHCKLAVLADGAFCDRLKADLTALQISAWLYTGQPWCDWIEPRRRGEHSSAPTLRYHIRMEYETRWVSNTVIVGAKLITFTHVKQRPASQNITLPASRNANSSSSPFSPMMRFTLRDTHTQQLFSPERWCDRNAVDGWLTLADPHPLPLLL
jgi:hypothetical protein